MTIGLTAAELAQMRADIAQLLPDTCNLLVSTYTSDGAGGGTVTWGTVTGGSAVPCRFDFVSPGNEAMNAAALTSYLGGVVSLPYDRTITETNRIEYNGEAWAVTGVNTGQSWEAVTRCNVERVP